MSDWERFGDWIATLAVASFAWASSALAFALPVNFTATIDTLAPAENQQSPMMSWAQQVDEPPIEQVGEDTGDDVETLDEAEPPADDGASADDTELLDQGAPPAAQDDEDIELLDQGPSAGAPVAESPAPSTSNGSVAPATTYVAPAPAAASGPFIPEGFGTGSVHVSAGRSGFPVGLEACHVGAVTGRAYVGIDCGDGSSVVGHAPSFEDFPFVLDESFPFDQESVFADRGGDDIADDVEIFVSAARGTPLDDVEAAPEIRTSGASSVQFAQRARDRKPRVEVEARGSKRVNDSNRGGNGDVDAAATDDSNDQTTAVARDKKKDKDANSRASAGDKEKKSQNTKKQGGKKGKKDRTSKRR